MSVRPVLVSAQASGQLECHHHSIVVVVVVVVVVFVVQIIILSIITIRDKSKAKQKHA